MLFRSYGNVTTAVAGGHGANIAVSVEERNKNSLIEHLVASGIPKNDASELASILESEEPSTKEEPFGQKAKNWIASNLKKAAEGTWKIGISTATTVITEAALKYYGLK